MKVTVIKDSVIYEQKIYKKDESFELDNEVAISLLERGYVQIEGGEEVAEALKEAGVDTISVPFQREELEAMEYKEVVALAKDLGLNAGGKKAEIIERILEFHADEEAGDDEELADGESESDELPQTDMPEM